MTKKEKEPEKGAEKRDLAIKGLVQRICTPVSTEKRLSAIKRFLSIRGVPYTEDECMCIWKGLFYSVWYTEMGKGCEEVVDAIAQGCNQHGRNLLLAGFQSLSDEWFGIDAIRLDKFVFFMRSLLRSSLAFEFRKSRAKRGVLIGEILSRVKNTLGLMFHFCDIYVEEVFVALNAHTDNLGGREKHLIDLTMPFITILETSDDARTRSAISNDVFKEMLQELDGRESAKTAASYSSQMSVTLFHHGKAAEVKKKNRVVMYNLAKAMKEKEQMLAEDNATKKSSLKRKAIDKNKPQSKRFVRSLVPVAL